MVEWFVSEHWACVTLVTIKPFNHSTVPKN